VAGKVTVGLASHWPCGTNFSGLSTYGLNGHGKGDERPTYAQYWGMVHFTFVHIAIPICLFTVQLEWYSDDN